MQIFFWVFYLEVLTQPIVASLMSFIWGRVYFWQCGDDFSFNDRVECCTRKSCIVPEEAKFIKPNLAIFLSVKMINSMSLLYVTCTFYRFHRDLISSWSFIFLSSLVNWLAKKKKKRVRDGGKEDWHSKPPAAFDPILQ